MFDNQIIAHGSITMREEQHLQAGVTIIHFHVTTMPYSSNPDEGLALDVYANIEDITSIPQIGDLITVMGTLTHIDDVSWPLKIRNAQVW